MWQHYQGEWYLLIDYLLLSNGYVFQLLALLQN